VQDFDAAKDDAAALENAKAKYLGKTGQITELMKGLGKLDPDAKKAQGALINAAKQQIEAALTARRDALAEAQMQARLNAEAIDVSLPGRGRAGGGIHPVMRTWERVEEIFRSIGFDVADGPEIETDWTNFTALNSPENHPARSMQDTFYIEGNDSQGKPLLLRTHTRRCRCATRAATAADQGDRAGPHLPRRQRCHPLADVPPGRRPVDRREHQLCRPQGRVPELRQGLLRDRRPASALPSVVLPVHRTVGRDRHRVRQRSAERPLAGSVRLRPGAPTVVRNFGLDPEKYIGFAFGSGLERLTMLRYGINDLRLFYEGDLRFLKQFN
jgi:phenylalanyl-tRNA synthetase alpha chain